MFNLLLKVIPGVLVVQTSTLISPEEQYSIRKLRLDYASSFLKPDAIERLKNLAKIATGPSKQAELGLLLQSMPMPTGKSTLTEELNRSRPSQIKSLRIEVFFYQIPQDGFPNKHFDLVKAFPYDFLSHDRFAFSALIRGMASPEVDSSISSLEELTDSHPIVLQLRAMRDRTPSRAERGDPVLWKKRSEQALVSLKLWDYAWRLYDKSTKAENREIKSWANYLRKRGSKLLEPTPEQYAAVKKRGWGFNKQMLEPFKKVD